MTVTSKKKSKLFLFSALFLVFFARLIPTGIVLFWYKIDLLCACSYYEQSALQDIAEITKKLDMQFQNANLIEKIFIGLQDAYLGVAIQLVVFIIVVVLMFVSLSFIVDFLLDLKARYDYYQKLKLQKNRKKVTNPKKLKTIKKVKRG